MSFDDLDFQSEHDDGLAAEALARSESPVCAEGHVADEVFPCEATDARACEKLWCEEHLVMCVICEVAFCRACAERNLERGICGDCLEAAA